MSLYTYWFYICALFLTPRRSSDTRDVKDS
jgi:hypothetical protein